MVQIVVSLMRKNIIIMWKMIFLVLKGFFECFSRFNDKINVDQMSEEDYYESIIYDSDDDVIYNYSDSDSDSDDD